jgi:hypothetical protein
LSWPSRPSSEIAVTAYVPRVLSQRGEYRFCEWLPLGVEGGAG